MMSAWLRRAALTRADAGPAQLTSNTRTLNLFGHKSRFWVARNSLTSVANLQRGCNEDHRVFVLPETKTTTKTRAQVGAAGTTPCTWELMGNIRGGSRKDHGDRSSSRGSRHPLPATLTLLCAAAGAAPDNVAIDAHLLNIFPGFAMFCISNIFSTFLHIFGSRRAFRAALVPPLKIPQWVFIYWEPSWQ